MESRHALGPAEIAGVTFHLASARGPPAERLIIKLEEGVQEPRRVSLTNVCGREVGGRGKGVGTCGCVCVCVSVCVCVCVCVSFFGDFCGRDMEV